MASRAARCRSPRSGRLWKSALRTSLTFTPSSSASACANSSGRRGVPFLSLSSAASTLSASTFSASASLVAKRASCFFWSWSNAVVTLSVEIPSAFASAAAKSSRRLPSSLWWKSRSACASLSVLDPELVREVLESRRLPAVEEGRGSTASVFLGRCLVAAGDGRAVIGLRAEAVAHGRHRERASDDDDRALSP